MRRTEPSRVSKRDVASAKITPGGQLIGPLVHKIFHLDSYPQTNTHKYKQTETYACTHTSCFLVAREMNI